MLLIFSRQTNTNQMKDTKWTDALIGLYCSLHGFKAKELTTREELMASFYLKNKINHRVYGLPHWEEKEEFIHPEGVAYLLGIYKKGQLIGSIHLMDLSRIASYASKVFTNATFDYQPKKTYEIKSFVVDTEYQKNIGAAFNILIYYAIRFTEKTGRNNWLVATRDTFYEKIKRRSGLPTEFISNENNYINDGSEQAQYFQNYEAIGGLENTCSYYINIPKGIIQRLAVKFLKIAAVKTLSKLRAIVLLPKFLQKTSFLNI